MGPGTRGSTAMSRSVATGSRRSRHAGDRSGKSRERSSMRAGMVVCPGFIDIQSHSLIPLLHRRALALEGHPGRDDRDHGRGLDAGPVRRADRPRPSARSGRLPEADVETRQVLERASATGWTTSATPALRSTSARSSAAARCGVRQGLGDWATRPRSEMETMRRVVGEAMEDGAFGVATALIYPPNAVQRPTPSCYEMCARHRRAPRRLHHPHALGGRRVSGGAGRDDRPGPADGLRAGAVPPEGRPASATGPRWPTAIEMIDAARAEGHGRHRRHVPVHRRRDRPGVGDPRTGPRPTASCWTICAIRRRASRSATRCWSRLAAGSRWRRLAGPEGVLDRRACRAGATGSTSGKRLVRDRRGARPALDRLR